MKRLAAVSLATLAAALSLGAARPAAYDYVVRGGEILDGSGGPPVRGDVAVKGQGIVYVGPHAPGRALKEIDARGKAVAPGFINMLSHSEDTFMADGRGLSELRQGVTLEIFGEGWSMGPLNARMKKDLLEHQGDIKYDIAWTTLVASMDKKPPCMCEKLQRDLLAFGP